MLKRNKQADSQKSVSCCFFFSLLYLFFSLVFHSKVYQFTLRKKHLQRRHKILNSLELEFCNDAKTTSLANSFNQ